MKSQNFIPNNVDCFDSDDSGTLEHIGNIVEFSSDYSENEDDISDNSEVDFSSTVSEFDSDDEKSDLNMDEESEQSSQENTKQNKDLEDSSNVDAPDKEDGDDDCDSDDSETAATMEDIFGVKPNPEIHRNHPPNFKTNNVAILDLCFHPENDLIAAASIDGDNVIYRYSMEKVEEASRYSHHKKSCRQVCFNSGGDLLFSVSKDKSIAVVDLESSQLKVHIEDAHEHPIYSFFEISHNLCATGDDNGMVKMWDLRKSKAVAEYNCGEESVTSLLACERNKFLSATVADGSLTGINLRKRQIETQSEMYDSEFMCQAFVRDEKKLVVGTGSGMLYIFNWGEFGYHADSFSGHPDLIQCIAPLTDKVIITGCEDGNIRAVHLYEHTFLGVIGQHKDFGVENIAISNDNSLLASCSLDEEIQFWDVEYLLKSNIKKNIKKTKTGVVRNLPSSRKRNRGEFFMDIPKNLESDDDQNGPVAGPSYESD